MFVPFLAAGLIAATLLPVEAGEGGQPGPATPKSTEQRLSDSLRDVINRGADLYNPPTRDHNGCYRLFQGALMVARVQLDNFPDLQKEIDAALTEAERLGPDGQRAFALRRALDRIRTTLGQKAPGDIKLPNPRSDEKKAPGADEKKPDEPKKPEDIKKPEAPPPG